VTPSVVEASFAEARAVFANHAAPAHREGIGHFRLTEFDACDAFRLSNKVQQTRRDYQIRYTRYQIKRTAKPLKFKKPDSWI
jgi:hypothetical protein